jgi:hypothetical protein
MLAANWQCSSVVSNNVISGLSVWLISNLISVQPRIIPSAPAAAKFLITPKKYCFDEGRIF